jgi:HlyD family secretion protein
MKLTLRLLLLAAVIAVGAAAYVKYWHDPGPPAPKFRTAAVTRGDLLATISATGTVEPEEVIDVGAQVAGAILSFGKDVHGKLIDYGSEVDAGTVLAQIDDSLYAADVAQTKAQLEQAHAGETRSIADLGQLKARFDQAERDWDRAQKLGPSDALAQVDYDAYRSAFEVARANVSVGDAACVQARGAIAQAQAAVDRAQRNLGYCTIKAPVKGVIIDRRVNIGQTVVASLNAPSLFLMAKDLKRMQVWVSVNEADIGTIRAGQPATFTVDAWPNKVFKGVVNKVRLNAAMTQNVVTYTVEVVTNNSSGRLLPYLTANAQFEIQHHKDVLLVPSAALRYVPQPEQVAPDARAEFEAARSKPARARPAADAADANGAASGESPGDSREPEMRRGSLWIEAGGFVRPLEVKVGPNDGTFTEVQGAPVKEGDVVVVGDARPDGERAASGANPFTPQFNRGGAPSGQGQGQGGGAPGGGAQRQQ